MTKIRSFHEAEEYLEKFSRPRSQKGGYKLDEIQGFLASIGNPQEDFKTIHVAGTSGKTSTCYYIASLLNEAGFKVGHTVSPHVDGINERAQIGLQPLSENEYCIHLNQFLSILKKSEYELSYFEIHIAFAYWLFAKMKLDYAVVEVGLGGLLDGTNTINRSDKICVITDIGYDHTEILGNTIQEIAMQKAGIIHQGNTVFMHEQGVDVEVVVESIASQMSADLYILPQQNIVEAKNLPPFQRRNFSIAHYVVGHIKNIENIKLSHNETSRSAGVYIPARMEITEFMGKTLILDGSHNIQKITALVEGINEQFPHASITCLLSLGENKNNEINGVLEILSTVANSIALTSFSSHQDEFRKAINPETLASVAKHFSYDEVLMIEDPDLAFDTAMNNECELIVVTGSFYLLNSIRPRIHKTK